MRARDTSATFRWPEEGHRVDRDAGEVPVLPQDFLPLPEAPLAVVLQIDERLAVPALTAEAGAEPIAERLGDVGPMAAMQQAKSPLIAVLLNPLIGVVGVLVGGGALGRGRRATSPQLSVASD